MKITPTSLLGGKATSLLLVLVSLLGAGRVAAQTTFSAPTTFANGSSGVVSGTGSSTVSSGSVYAIAGTTTNNITGETFGQNFIVTTNNTSAQGGTAAWGYQGNIGGAAIPASTTIPIKFDFTIGSSAGITSAITWKVYFRGGTNTELQIATGSVAGNGATTAVSGTANYLFTTGATTSDTYRAYIDVGFTSNTAANNTISVSMANSGFGGGGITLNASAIPEPSTYAAIAGAAMLGLAVWQRRGRKLAVVDAKTAATV